MNDKPLSSRLLLSARPYRCSAILVYQSSTSISPNGVAHEARRTMRFYTLRRRLRSSQEKKLKDRGSCPPPKKSLINKTKRRLRRPRTITTTTTTKKNEEEKKNSQINLSIFRTWRTSLAIKDVSQSPG